MADANVRGRFVWHELYTPNPAGAHEFYGKAVGWKTQAWDQDADYVMFLAPSGPNVDRACKWLADGVALLRDGTAD